MASPGQMNITDVSAIQDERYGYVPTQYVCALFVALYGLSTLLHFGQAIGYRLWFMIPTAGFGGILECLGWSGRLWSSHNPILRTPFLIQITSCIIGPTPLLAANFVILGLVIDRLGGHYSRLPSKWYTIVFCTCDVIALVVQGTGGGLASTANTLADEQRGGRIILGGIVFQLAVIITYTAFAAEFLYRHYYDRPIRVKYGSESIHERPISREVKTMLFALAFNTLCLFIRAIYRTIELADGWQGRIIRTQVYFNVLDGGMVTLAIYTLNFFHPGRLLGPFQRANPAVDPSDSSGSVSFRDKVTPQPSTLNV